MRSSLPLRFLAILAASSAVLGAGAQKFCDKGPAQKPVTVGAHALFGGSAITQNYAGCFKEIREIDASTGTAWGGGLSVEFGLRDYLALGTQINVLLNSNRINIAVSNSTATNVSNVFLSNHYNYLNFPVYLSLKFNVAPTMRWNVDGGVYYSYGFGGNQKQTAYTSSINELGQLINHVTVYKPDYFNDSMTFINRYRRGDIGLYVATGLTIKRHYHLGVRSMIGFKNASTVSENVIVNPNIHNFNIMMELGYSF